MWRTYDCPVTECEYDTHDVWDLALHIDQEHPEVDHDVNTR